MNLKFGPLLIFFFLCAHASATPLSFDYKDPKEISAVSLTIDSVLEPIVGYAKGVSGTVSFDPAHPERSSGKIAVEVGSIQFSNDGYTKTARGYALNEKKFPQVFISLRKILRVKETSKGRFEGDVLADFTCRGVTQPKRLSLVATYLPGRAEERTNGRHKGDLLILRTKFEVSRKAHGISTGIPDDMVSDRIDVGVAIVGIHYADEKPPQKLQVEMGDRFSFQTRQRRYQARVLNEQGGVSRFRWEKNSSCGKASGEFGRAGILLHRNETKLVSAIGTPSSVLGIRKGESGKIHLGGDSYGYVVVLQNRMMAWRFANDVAGETL